jgi:sulfur carrier protein
MKLTINGTPCDVRDGVTVEELLQERSLDTAGVIVELNRALLASARWDTADLAENDCLEIVSFVGGG